MPASVQTRNSELGYSVFDQVFYKITLCDAVLCQFEFTLILSSFLLDSLLGFFLLQTVCQL